MRTAKIHLLGNPKAEPDIEAALRQLDSVCAECKKHKGEYFDMDCPYCGAKKTFFVHNTSFEANGVCSICSKPFHVLWNQNNREELI